MFWRTKRETLLRSHRPDAPVIRLGFSDFWPGFDPRDNYFTYILRDEYSLLLCDRPDFLIYSCFGRDHRRQRCVKIFFTGENVRPNFDECDFAFTFDHRDDDPRHVRWPLYAWWEDPERLIKPLEKDWERVLAAKTRFCNFIYGNGAAERRLKFLDRLMTYKTVDCAGTLLNNTGHTVNALEKVDYIRAHKFTIAFENESFPGYTTEKIVHPMLADSVAIYWGNPLINLDFDPGSFVNVHDFASDEEALERIIELDTDNQAYLKLLATPFYHGNVISEYADPGRVLRQFRRIFGVASAGT